MFIKGKQMRMSFEIDDSGRVLMPASARNPITSNTAFTTPVQGLRNAQSLLLRIRGDTSHIVLMSLISTIRPIQVEKVEVFQPKDRRAVKSFVKKSEACLYLGRVALSRFEQTSSRKFASYLSEFHAGNTPPVELPFFIRNIAQVKRAPADLPDALSQLDEDVKKNGSYYRLDADHNLTPMKLPHDYLYPRMSEYQDIMNSKFGKWVNIVGQVSVAVQSPLLQFGHFFMEHRPDEPTRFVRITVPFIGEGNRPINHRIITLSFLPDKQNWMI